MIQILIGLAALGLICFVARMLVPVSLGLLWLFKYVIAPILLILFTILCFCK